MCITDEKLGGYGVMIGQSKDQVYYCRSFYKEGLYVHVTLKTGSIISVGCFCYCFYVSGVSLMVSSGYWFYTLLPLLLEKMRRMEM